MSDEEMPVCEEWVSEEVSDEESDEELHVYEFKTTETRAKYLCRDLYVLVAASARHPLRVRGSDASVRQAKKIQTDMQNMQIAAQLVKLGQYKRGGSSKKGKSKRGKGPCLRLSSRKGKAKGKSSKGKAEMQGGSSKNTLHQEARLLMTLGNPKEDSVEEDGKYLPPGETSPPAINVTERASRAITAAEPASRAMALGDRLERAEKRQKTAEKRQRDVLMRTSLWQKARDEKAERENNLRLLFPPANVPLGPWSWKQHYDEKPTKYNRWPPQR